MKQDAGRKALGDFAEEFAHLNDDILFGEVWSREDKLNIRDRSIITLTALITKGIFDNSLKYHINNAKIHGVTKEEMVEIITHLAFYAGWPNAWAVFPIVKEIYSDCNALNDSDSLFGLGKENVEFQQYFIGKSYLKPLILNGVKAFNVTFEPGGRNNWHIHHKGGQLLLCTDGNGWYQEEGKKAKLLHPGDVVYISPELKHWHGATKNHWFTHVAIEIPAEGAFNKWCEPVTDEEYNLLDEI